MAFDMTPYTCTNCANASVCPHKEIFMKLYENRDKLMIKCGDPDHPFDDNVDTSKEITVRVQHRYLDGPALEKLYRDLGLNGADCACVAAYSGCPLMQHYPFDAPIYAPYPHAVGYPRTHCAKDSNGNNLEYIAPMATPRTNEVHASPYLAYPGLAENWLSCKNCSHYTDCQGHIDYAKLGGTIYSTFGYSDVKVKAGGMIHLADIPTPKTIMPGYYRAERNPEVFTVASEEDKLIIYYSTRKPVADYARMFGMDGPIWMTMDEIKEAGMMHDVELFYKDLSYVYPSDGTTTLPMEVYLEGIICGPINRQSKDGEVVCVTGDYVPMSYTHNDIEPMYDVNQSILLAKDQYIASYTGKKITIMDDGIKLEENENINSFDINVGNYRKLSLVQGDRLIVGFHVDAKYKLDTSMMKLMNYGEYVDMEVVDDRIIGGQRYIRLIMEVPESDCCLQTCMTEEKYLLDPANFKPIDYLSTWNPLEIAMNTPPIEVMNGDVKVRTYRPLAPRKWPAGSIPDKTPKYTDDVPPSSQFIVRPFFDLIGYTDEANRRLKFDPSTHIMHAMQCTYPNEVRFIDTMDNRFGVVWAMWAMLHNRVHGAMEAAFEESKIKMDLKPHVTQMGDFIPKVATQIEKPMPGVPDEMRMMDPVHVYDLNLNHTPNHAETMLNWMRSLDLPDNFKAKIYAVPLGAVDLTLHSNYEHEHIEPIPYGQLTYSDDTGMHTVNLSDLEIRDDNLDQMENRLKQSYIMTVYPRTAAGMTQYCQNFVAYQINTMHQPLIVDVTFIMHGADMMLNFSPAIALEKARAYQMDGVCAEDIEDVYLEVEGNVLKLAGSKAQFYVLSPTCNVKYQEVITVKSGYTNMPVEDEANYTVTYRDAAEFDFYPPDKDAIGKIKVDDIDIMSVIDGKVVLNPVCLLDETSVDIQMMDDAYGHYHVKLHNISGDHTIQVFYREGNDGTIEGCHRCREYVHTSEYPFVSWTPKCEYYKPTRC